MGHKTDVWILAPKTEKPIITMMMMMLMRQKYNSHAVNCVIGRLLAKRCPFNGRHHPPL